MALTFCPLYSGSSGNCTFVSDGKSTVLIDAGLSGKQICSALDSIGCMPECINGIVITHEHSDHIKGAGILSRKYHIPIYANERTWNAMGKQLGEIPPSGRRFFETGHDFFIGDLNISSFPIPHDAAEPVGFRIFSGGVSVASATDMGILKKETIHALAGSHIILLESNHDPDMLLRNPHYSSSLKNRILGRHGHLSNESCAKGMLELVETGVHHFILGHLSAENNTPALAMETALQTAVQGGLHPNRDIFIDMAWRDRPGERYSIEL